jgi:(1->4)-alpha-D-glucan 1-alpha-D-glucosylmutase
MSGVEVPDANEEYLFYQILVGAWPLTPLDEIAQARFVQRIVQYMEKALKEAKIHTSWLNPHEAYDQAVQTFIQRVLTPGTDNRFLADFALFQARIAPVGLLNALSQTLLKITSPGVPDFYQGTELWDDSLVDPDNRRPVDFPTRRACLAALQQREIEGLLPLVQELLAQWWDGRIKLYATYKALHFRRSHIHLFRDGAYLPILCTGTKREHVVAFARCKEQSWTLVVIPRLLTKLSSRRQPPVGRRVWGKNFLLLPPEAPLSWHNVLTGEALTGTATPQGQTLHLSTILRHFPVALLSGTLPQTTDPARLLSAPTARP